MLFLRAWPWLQEPYTAWHLKAPVSLFWWETILNVVILAAVLFAGQSVIRRIPWKGSPMLLRLGLVAGLAIILKRLNELNSWIPIRPIILWLDARGRIVELLILSLIAASLVLIVIRICRTQKLVQGMATGLIILSSLFFFNIYQAGKASFAGNAEYADLAPRSHSAPQAPGPRVVWLVFDTFDYYYAFEGRPEWLKLPELDRLRDESVFFTDAQSPAERTEKSIPSLLTGLVVTGQSITSPRDYKLTLGDGSKVAMRGMPTIFSQAEDMGVRTAALGVYIPYGRILGDQLSYCRWWQWGNLFDSTEPMSARLLPQLTITVGKPLSVWMQIDRQIRNHLAQVEEAKRLVSGDDYRLVFAHFFPPHMPTMYDGKLGQFSNDAYWHSECYQDALALVDRTLGELRREMEAAGTWDKSLVIVTSDHSFRLGKDWGYKVHKRIPFLCHFPGEAAGLTHVDEINTIFSHDMILRYLDGAIKTPAEFVDWLGTWAKTAPKINARDDGSEEQEEVFP